MKTYKTYESYNFAFLTISSALIGFYLSLSLFQKKRKILAEVKMKKLDVNHGGTSSDAFFLKSRSLCPALTLVISKNVHSLLVLYSENEN